MLSLCANPRIHPSVRVKVGVSVLGGAGQVWNRNLAMVCLLPWSCQFIQQGRGGDMLYTQGRG